MKNNLKGRLIAAAQFSILIIAFTLILFENKFYVNEINRTLSLIGDILFVICILLFLAVLINFRQIITPNPVPLNNSKLITNGIYKYIRHPMYSIVLLMVLALILKYNSFYTIFFLPIIFLFFIFKINFEEKQLIKKFPKYSEYKKTSKKLIPFIY
jgi:protein-S-isoprenylcysteine O-methyltransferase Ste14